MLWDTTIGAPQEWDVIAGGLTCMKMKMDAVVVHPIYDIASEVPKDANITSYSECPEDTAIFEATWVDKGFVWKFALQFKENQNNYFLERFYGVVKNEDGSVRRRWSYVEYSYPMAALGDSMSCNLLVTARTRFIDYQWQPFAQEAGGEYGPADECDRRLPPVAVFFCVFISVLAVVVSFVLYIIINAGS
ncbi:hypothetical protein BSL78_18059 [Apostichopus japonicus]|uniref:Uncharacterized protein n=1 Tax=Stichopus japonicus TaxID=307972 RepID=A0A2G8KAQ6_STIJA|nr:hypothetical protein BSL78_18059 [Apostichopus japonicus]